MEHQLKKVLAEIQIFNNRIRRPYINISPREFKNQWFEIFQALNPGKSYVIDNDNREIINQLYYYLTGNKKFTGDHNKGILLIGGYGTGKTQIMNILKYLIQANADKILTFLSCPNLLEEIKEKKPDYYFKRPLILDELGREVLTVKDYGTERKPIIEILTQRYNYRSWTFATSNYKPETLGEIYGHYIQDRFNEMFNTIKLTGETRRK